MILMLLNSLFEDTLMLPEYISVIVGLILLNLIIDDVARTVAKQAVYFALSRIKVEVCSLCQYCISNCTKLLVYSNILYSSNYQRFP